MQRTQAGILNLEAMASSPREPTFHNQTFTVGHAGFPPILWDMLTQALGCSVSP